MTSIAPSRACQAADPSSCKYHGDPSRKSRQDSLVSGIRALLDGGRSSPVPASFHAESRSGHLYEMLVAEGNQTQYCPHCGNAFTESMEQELWEGHRTECSVCSEELAWDKSRPSNTKSRRSLPPYEVRVRPDQVKFLTDHSAVLKARWFHTTSSVNWLESVREDNVQVHLGSESAALGRGVDLKGTNKYDPEPVIYELRLKDGARVDPRIFEDENNWDEEGFDGKYGGAAEPAPYSRTKVNRYVNEWEAPGQVSLLVHPSLIEVVSVREIQ